MVGPGGGSLSYERGTPVWTARVRSRNGLDRPPLDRVNRAESTLLLNFTEVPLVL